MTTEHLGVIPVNIEDKMRTAYLEYAMSVIVGRALPDVRDGLKPVHRRILYAMHSLNVAHNKPYMKSARIVGEVIGKYHPHGDTAVYDAVVRLAQDFSMRQMLVEGQGNFGSIDGDSAAAMRYTEVRMQKITREFLEDLEKNTVNFTDNYDGSLKEPSVLPTKIPNLLVNGSTGIAVGMATNIPPHNLTEVINGLLYYIDHRKTCVLEELLPFIKGPDFPTAGQILGRDGLYSMYKTGKGVIKIRAKHHIEPIAKTNREAIIVTEIPYMVNKARLIEKIAGLVKDKSIDGIQDLRDESDRKGMRIVIELKRNENADTILANLYKHTALQNSFGATMLAVVDGQPQILPLVDILKYFLNHRIDVVVRRTQFELQKAEARVHILEGLKIALDNIDEVVQLIRSSPNGKEAKERLVNTFSLSEIQAQAILDMRLQRLTALEFDKLVEELEALHERIKWFKEVLANEQLVLDIIKEELIDIKDAYPSERRSEIVEYHGDIVQEDLIPVEKMVVTMSRNGYIKRCTADTYQSQNRGGKGKLGMSTGEEDFLERILVASSHDTLLIFSSYGKVYWKKVYELPLSGRTSKGRAWVNILPLEEDEKVMFCTPVSEYSDDKYIVMITENGTIKKTSLSEYSNQRTKGTKAIVIDENDTLKAVGLCTDQDQVFIATQGGMALKVDAGSLRTQGRVTRGCRGIKLKDGADDKVISMEVIQEDSTILTVTANGFGKKTPASDYRLGSRGNMGVMNIKASDRIGEIVGSVMVTDENDILLITQKGKVIRMKVSQIRSTGRVTQGVRLINLDADEQVVSVARIEREEEEENLPEMEGVESAETDLEKPLSEQSDAPQTPATEEDTTDSDAANGDEK